MYSLDRGLAKVGAGRWPWKIAGVDKDGNPRLDDKIIKLERYDPSPIRGLKPPPPDSTTRIPVAIGLSSGSYAWCDLVFNDLLKLQGLVRPEQLHLFAIMLEGHAQHFVIDLDGDADVWPQLLGKEVEIEVELRALFCEFYHTQFGAAPDMSAWRADSVPAPASGAPSKTSLHVNHPGVAFKTQRDLREFVLRFVRWIVTTHADSILVNKEAPGAGNLTRVEDFDKATPVDVKVYNKDRNMRLSYSRKPGVGKLPLLPMDPNTTREDALWSSLVCYSMPADPAEWLSYNDHPECAALGSPSRKRRAAELALPDRPTRNGSIPTGPAAPLVVTSAEDGGAEPGFKGTWAQMSPKVADAQIPVAERGPAKVTAGAVGGTHPGLKDMADHFAAAMSEEWDAATFMRYMPQPKQEDVKLILTSLSREKRLLGHHDTWRNVVWAVKAVCPSDAGYAIVEEWTKGGKSGSKRPGVLMKTWLSGRADRFNIASLWKWAKEDLTGDAYRALWTRINPPEVMEAARKAAADLNQGAVARVVESWQQTFGKRDENKELVYDVRKIDKGNGDIVETRARGADGCAELVYEVYNELPQREVMRWFAKIPAELLERITDVDLMQELMERTVLPMCNVYWKFLKEKKQDRVFVKQQCDQADDDRKYRWLEMTEKRFLGAAHADFKLKGVHGVKENLAHVWLAWHARETYNGPACVPETARKEQTPAPFQLNEWVGLRVSHARARRDGDPKHKDWVDFKRYLWNAMLQGEPDQRVKEYFCKWYISQYVRPGYKLKVALVLYSELNQIGKTELARFMRVKLLGDTVGVECQSEDALDKFNELIGGRLLVFLEEFARCKAYNDRFKIEITSDTHNINGKNDKIYTEPNCSNWMVATNYKDATDLNTFSKRVFVVLTLDGINTILKTVDADGHETRFDYSEWKDRNWDPVHIAAGMLEWAKELDLDNWDPTDIPVSEGMKLQRRAGEEAHDPVAAWWRKLVTNSARADEVTWDSWNSVQALFQLFMDDNADDKRLCSDMSKDRFSEAFSRRGFTKRQPLHH